MKKFAWVKVLVAFFYVFELLQPGISIAAAQPQTINLKIALLAPITGPIPSYGAATRNGVEMALAEWNAKGGVLGRTVSMDIHDTQCDGTAATTEANNVVAAGTHYIIGELCSGATIPISEIAEAHHIVQISPLSTNPQVTVNGDGTVKQYVFRACFIDPFQGRMMARFALRQGWTKAYILHDPNNPYSSELADAFRGAYLGSGNVVGYDTYSAGDTDFSALLGRIKTSGATIVYLPDFFNVVNTILTQAKAQGVTATFLGGDGWSSSDLDLTAAEGAYYSEHFSPADPQPAVQQWVGKYQTTYGQPPDSTAALSYDSTNMLLAAIQAVGVDDPVAVKDYLAKNAFTGITGHIRFDANHNPEKNIVIQQIKNHAVTFKTSFIEYQIFLPSTLTNPAPNTKQVKACLITDVGGIHDSGFNASAWQGLLDAKANLGASANYLESATTADYAKNIDSFIAQGCDLIETVGFLMGDATQAAAQAHPGQKFSIVDYSYSPVLTNTVGQTFSTEQNSFLVGYLAAGMTKTGKVSTFGGMDIPPVTQFMDGYYQGVQYYNQENGTGVQVIGWNPTTHTGDFTNDFSNITAGHTMAQAQLNQGADIVFPLAGTTGLGAADAVQAKGNSWVIGVDTDWVFTNPQYSSILLTSAMKNIQASTYAVIASVNKGTFNGSTYSGTLANNGVSLGTISAAVPTELIFKMNQVKAGIIAGSIIVTP
jgi:basic membrane lipoprotein Med (substrate-binding protein (PBP1-ABC) superfamily)/ABC-type branched-subunit amino acid transport system substrate-binding protein